MKTRTFADFDLSFQKHPVTNDLVMKYDENAIKASIKNLVMTSNYERPFDSSIGSQTMGLMFNNTSVLTQITLKRTITDTINTFEPRAVLESVDVQFSPDENSAYISIYYKIVNTERPQRVDLILERTR